MKIRLPYRRRFAIMLATGIMGLGLMFGFVGWAGYQGVQWMKANVPSTSLAKFNLQNCVNEALKMVQASGWFTEMTVKEFNELKLACLPPENHCGQALCPDRTAQTS